MDVLAKIKEIDILIEQFKKYLVSDLSKIPDNPKINRIGANCFTIGIKDLGLNFSPTYHDSLFQANALQEMVKDCSNLDTIKNILTSIVKTGKYNSGKYNYVIFNDDVRTYVKNLLGEN